MDLNKDYVCIFGVYGKGNLGDEALLMAIVDSLHTLFPLLDIIVFCSKPKVVIERYGIKAFSRTLFSNFFKKLILLKKAKTLIVGGGDINMRPRWYD